MKYNLIPKEKKRNLSPHIGIKAVTSITGNVVVAIHTRETNSIESMHERHKMTKE